MKPKIICTTPYVQSVVILLLLLGASMQCLYAQQIDRDYGDLPDTYSTTAANNGASHLVYPGFSLGSLVDTDPDGMPATAGQPALGDDTDADGDDEDGVIIPSPLWACATTYITVHLTNTAGMSTANLDAWMDFNGNGVFDVDIERVTDSSHRPDPFPLVPGDNLVPITVPCNAQTGSTYARFRLSDTNGIVNPFDQRGPGEVEDYQISITGVSSPGLISGLNWCESSINQNGTYDPGDGDAPIGDVRMEIFTDPNCDQSYDDGFRIGSVHAGANGWYQFTNLSVGVQNEPVCYLAAPTLDDINLGLCNQPITPVPEPVALTDQNPTDTSVDFGFVSGESTDYSDAPIELGSACHLIDFSQPRLGASITGESGPFPGTEADGDLDDGVQLPDVIFANVGVCAQVIAPNGGELDAWIDYNINGVFEHPTEHLFGGVSQTLLAIESEQTVCFTPPNENVNDFTYARFRISSFGGLLPSGDGCAKDGEVEDYKIDAKLPVELSRFELTPHADRSVSLDWMTTSETNNAGFEIQHRHGTFGETVNWNAMAFVEGHGTTVETKRYSYQVGDLQPGVHQFRLKQIDFDGAYEYSPTIETRISIPDDFVVEDVWPNPFSSQASFQFAVNKPEWITVTLYDLLGRPLRTLYEGRPIANRIQKVTIDGSGLPNDVYLIRVVGETVDSSQKIILLK